MADETKTNDTNEPKVHEEIQNELKKMGDSYNAIKKNYEDLQKSVKSLQDEDKSQYVDLTKLEKLKEDIITRQEDLDSKIAATELKEAEMKKRIDEFELMAKRSHGIGATPENSELQKQMKEHYIACRAAQRQDTTREQLDNMTLTEEDYKGYLKTFENFLVKGDRILTPDELKTLSVGVDPHGGYTVTPAMGSTIMANIYERDPIRQLASVTSISTDSIEYLVDNDEANAGWVSETAPRGETSTPDMEKKKIFVHEMYAAPRATQQLLDDSSINIESWLGGKVADKFSRLEGVSFITGDGLIKPRGILTYANGTTYGTVEQINMGAAGAITADGYIKIKYGMKEAYIGKGTWLMHRTSVRDTMLLKNGAGDYIWKPGLSQDQNDTILNLPVRMSTTMPTIAANSLSVALADWKLAYQIVDRMGIRILRDPYTAKPYIIFYTTKRVGGDIVNYEAMKIGKIAA